MTESTEKKSSRQLMQELIGDAYQRVRDAKAEGRPIGFSTSNFPKEIPATFGLEIVYPENHSAAVAAKKGALHFCEKAEGMGYTMDTCAYARVNLGFIEREEDFGFGLDVPKPDFVLVGNNICTTVIKWYENLAYNLDIPFIFIDFPYSMEEEYQPYKMKYIKDQVEQAILQLEEITGTKFDYDKFQRLLETSSENGRLFLECMDLIGENNPSPVSGFDAYNLMGLMVVAKPFPETGEVFKAYIAELKELVAKGETRFKGEENYRVMFDGLACWPYLRQNSEFLASQGVNLVGSIYARNFGTQFTNLAELCASYATTNNARGLEIAIRDRRWMLENYNCEGILAHCTRSCKPWVGIQPEMIRQLSEEFQIPYTFFDGDQTDPRAFSQAQYETRVQGLVELMDQKKAAKE